MNMPARDAVFWSGFALAVLPLAAVLAVLVSFLLPFIPLDMKPIENLSAGSWWLLGSAPFPASPSHPLWGLAAAAAALCAALAAGLRARVLNAQRRAPEISFFLLFLFSFSTEPLRAGVGALHALEGSVSAGILLSRAVYLGRFLGQLSLLVTGLYALDLKYRNVTALIGAQLLIAFAIASNIPLDRTVLLSTLVYKLGDEQTARFVTFTLALLTLACGVGAFVTRRSSRYLSLAASFLLLLAGREVLFAGTGPIVLAGGLAAFLTGIALFLRAIQGIYRETGAEKTGGKAG